MLKNVTYVLTTHDINLMPKDDLKEYVIIGRSNVGKSSFINSITNNKNLAKTSSKPGKTRAISFFDVDGKYRLVDIPGYGYAKVSKDQKKMFAQMIDTYLSQRKNIAQIILLLDIRRGITPDDEIMINYFFENNISFVIIGTKLDKVNQSEKHRFEKLLMDSLSLRPLLYSSIKKTNLDKVLNIFEN